jgi:uncharacterized damage-inducible protein DinB
MTDRAPVPEGRASFQRANDESRERLTQLVATLTPTQLAADLGEGWTVASALAHMGFWDRWQAERWTEMLAGRWTASNESILAAEHLANDALHPYWARVRAEDIPALAIEAAGKVDALIASAPDATINALEGTSVAFLVHRHSHRGDHLDHIERVLAATAAGAAAAGGAAAGVDRGFVARNDASRRRLANFVERVRESEMSLPTEEGGWTVAQVLAHVAFWDRSMEARWRLAQTQAGDGGALEPFGIPGEMTEAINPPLADMVGAWASRLGRVVAEDALAAAQSLDALIEELAPGIADAVVRDKPNFADRSIHRDSHLDQLEKALATVRAPRPPIDRSYLERNETSRAQLRDAIAGLSATQLARRTEEGGWTVGQVLGHMAFWDRFLEARWRAAIAAGPAAQPTVLPHELADLLNAALPPIWSGIATQPSAIMAETLAAADEVDAVIASLPAEAPVLEVLAARTALLDRSIHRREHLAQIERAIG